MARPTLFSNRKLLKLAQRLQSKALAIGSLELLWHVCNETGDPVLGDADDVEAIADWRGERGELVAALVGAGSNGGAGFLEQISDGRYAVHDFWHHAPDYVRKRARRESERRKAGDELHLEQVSSRPVTDRSLTGQNGTFPDCLPGVVRTPAPAPAPAPARKEEDSPLAIARGAPVADATFREQLLELYAEILPGLPQPKLWTKRRQVYLEARIRETLKRGKQADSLEWWRKFFERVAASDFLMGQTKTAWRCPGLEWLLRPENFAKVIEGAYENTARRSA